MTYKTFTSTDGLELAYQDHGPKESSAAPLLCLAGLTRNSRDFEPIFERFGRQRRIVALDSRGRGESARDPIISNYSPLVETNDALALVDHLGLRKIVLFGTSRGGLLGFAIGNMRRDLCAGMILNDVGPVIEPDGLDALMDYVGLPVEYPSFEAMAEAFAQNQSKRYPGVTAEEWLPYIRRGWRDDGTGRPTLNYDPRIREVLHGQRGDAPPDLWPFFEGIKALPMLLLRGANSDLLSRETVTEMRRRKPDLRAVEVPRRGHIPFLDERESVEAVRRFLDDLDMTLAAAESAVNAGSRP